MEFTKSLLKGKLIKRYKRFFVDVNLNKEIVTAHCPNTGSMKGLLDEGNEVHLFKHDDPKRKLKYGLEIIKALIISRPYFNFLFGSSCLNKCTSLPSSSKPFIDPVFGQCAVTISLFRFTSTKKRLYLLINLPFNKDLVNSIFELYI